MKGGTDGSRARYRDETKTGESDAALEAHSASVLQEIRADIKLMEGALFCWRAGEEWKAVRRRDGDGGDFITVGNRAWLSRRLPG